MEKDFKNKNILKVILFFKINSFLVKRLDPQKIMIKIIEELITKI